MGWIKKVADFNRRVQADAAKDREQKARTEAAVAAIAESRAATDAAADRDAKQRAAARHLTGKGGCAEWNGRALVLRGGVGAVPREMIRGPWGNVRQVKVNGTVTIPVAAIAAVGTHRGWMQVTTTAGREYLALAPAEMVEAIAAAVELAG
jgi:hypothetical protein